MPSPHCTFKNGILLRSIGMTVLAFALVGVATISYTAYATRARALQESGAHLDQLLATVQSTAQVACFVKDVGLATEVARGLMNNPEVLRVRITEGDVTLAELARASAAPAPAGAARPVLRRDVRSPFQPDHVIGQIRLTPDPAVLERRVRSDILDQAVQLFWQLALIAASVVITLLLFVVRPISAMSALLQRLDPTTGARLPVPPAHVRTEIGALARNVNALADRLVDALDEEHALRLRREVDERKYRAIFDNAGSGIFLIDAQAMLSGWNPAFAELMGLAPAATPADSRHLHDLPWDEGDASVALLGALIADPAGGSAELPIRRPDGGRVWLNITLSAIGSSLMQGIVHDISDLKQAEVAARLQAVTDPVTGLVNRAGLELHLHELIGQYTLSRGPAFTLLLIDLDRFRLVIEGTGVAAGDDLLRSVAGRLQSVFKRADLLARLSADIFGVVLQELSHAETIEHILDRVMHSLRQPYAVGSTLLQLHASIGITVFPTDGVDAPTLLHHAELAVLKAKAAGGNTPVFFDATLAEAAESRRHLENDLRVAIRDQHFELFYQPVLDLKRNRVSGAEALIRWRHPQRGLIMPDQFIGLAEETGLINEIGLWVLDEACLQLQRWQAAGLDYQLSINVSGRQIPHGFPPSAVAQALQRHGIGADRLALEITEGVLLDNVDEALHWLDAIHQLGLRVYLDDFGTGYSALSYLNRFQLETLKIDRAFVRDMQAAGNERSLVQAIIAMASSLGMSVIAEGVETASHLQILREMGCHFAQGYYLSRPVPIKEFGAAAEHIKMLLEQAPQLALA
jgi:diguanylate cyclase (GGDEF)-like protein/PAS domain S-box-containing protein